MKSKPLTKEQYDKLVEFRDNYMDAAEPDLKGIDDKVYYIVEEIVSCRDRLEDAVMDLDEVLMNYDDEEDDEG